MNFQTDAELYSTVGKNIKFYREQHHLTQIQLAELCQISTSYISKIEATGSSKSVSISVLNQIANALNTDISKFFTRR